MKLQDLKRGMRCTYRNGVEFIVSKVNGKEIEYLDRKQVIVNGIYNINNDLTHEYNERFDIVKVEDITLDGYVTIWEREEPKYYLRLPNDFIGVELMCSYYLNFNKLAKKHFFDTKLETTISQTQFTQAEIDKLDTTYLIKEEVE